MFEYRHIAFSISTGEIICCERGNQLKRLVAHSSKWNRKFNVSSQWRFCHDYGKNWDKNGFPKK